MIPDFKVGMVPNVGTVVGSRATLVVDPGMEFKNGQVVLREVQKVSQGSNIYIVNTHFHPEHTTGEVAFPPSAQVIRAAAQQQDVDEMGMQWVERFRQRSPEIDDLLKEATFRLPAEIFEQETMLDLGGVRVRLIRLGPGHTRVDTVAFVEGDRVLFSGDLVMKNLFPAFATPHSDSRAWLASLDQLLDGECGRRDTATVQKLVDRLAPWEVKVYGPDTWATSASVIPQDHWVQRTATPHDIERHHCRPQEAEVVVPMRQARLLRVWSPPQVRLQPLCHGRLEVLCLRFGMLA